MIIEISTDGTTRGFRVSIDGTEYLVPSYQHAREALVNLGVPEDDAIRTLEKVVANATAEIQKWAKDEAAKKAKQGKGKTP